MLFSLPMWRLRAVAFSHLWPTLFMVVAVFLCSTVGALLVIFCFLLLRLFRAIAWGQYRWAGPPTTADSGGGGAI